MLDRLGFDVTNSPQGSLSSDNAAVVIVTAELPAFAKEGTRLDVKVDSIYDAESLEGGQLLMETYLMVAPAR
jgi:flagellar P-ring protein precursor FlgI